MRKANQRLGRLLDDVAAITRLDDGSTKIAVEEINIAHIVAETIERHIMQAEAKNISIVQHGHVQRSDSRQPLAYGDP